MKQRERDWAVEMFWNGNWNRHVFCYTRRVARGVMKLLVSEDPRHDYRVKKWR